MADHCASSGTRIQLPAAFVAVAVSVIDSPTASSARPGLMVKSAISEAMASVTRLVVLAATVTVAAVDAWLVPLPSALGRAEAEIVAGPTATPDQLPDELPGSSTSGAKLVPSAAVRWQTTAAAA